MSRLCQTAADEIAALERDGLKLSLEEIVWLNDLGREVETPEYRQAAAGGKPVACGPLWLWPYTLQGGRWYTEVACRHFKGDEFLTWALGFSLALGREEFLPDYCSPLPLNTRHSPVTFAHISTRDAAYHAVNAWALRLPVTKAQLRSAIIECLPEIDAPHHMAPRNLTPETSSPDILSELAAGSGQPCEYWERQLSVTALHTLTAIYRQRSMAFGGNTPAVDEGYKKAFHNFMAASDAIRKSREEKENPTDQSDRSDQTDHGGPAT